MHRIGEPVPESWIVETEEQLEEVARQGIYPLIVQPAYTLSGTGGNFAHTREELMEIGSRGLKLSMRHQVMVERYSSAGRNRIRGDARRRRQLHHHL